MKLIKKKEVLFMKKKIALLLAIVTLVASMFAFAGCSKNEATAEKTDLDYIKEKGTLVVGITDFAPMDYQDESGKWIGFDADMATAFAESLGVKAEFIEIDWDNKTLELNNKSIDCVWNGMTLDDEVTAAMECSKPYCNNAQTVVMAKADAEKYNTVDACKALSFAVEKGSAGSKEATANGFTVVEVDTQAKALLEVKSGNSDATVIDKLMAGAMIGEGTDYADLTTVLDLNAEEYGVGFRKGSNMADELNKFFDACAADGTALQVAEEYGVQEALLIK